METPDVMEGLDAVDRSRVVGGQYTPEMMDCEAITAPPSALASPLRPHKPVSMFGAHDVVV